ncbi:hypothetical protein WMY93_034302 [Mugilogobius chulae]|uniref:L1 transposable element RRM domain-containing protein n=1 Tax=Mugilogobius chulae TaxID=88201 RepID=A0AAW0MJ88_9GOBI
MDTRKGKKYTQTTLDAESLSTGDKSETAKANASPSSADEESSISLGTLRAELRTQFEMHREVTRGDIKMEIETHCKEIRDDIAALRDQTKADIKTLRDELTERVNKLSAMQTNTANTQKDMEKSLTDTTDRLVILEKEHHSLASDYKKLYDKCVDLENRSRRQNVRIVGVKEGAENGNPTSIFVARLLAVVLGKENFEADIVVDRAHRSLGPQPRTGERPRAIIAPLHYYADKEKVMSLSRAKGKLLFDGSPVHIFPDMSPEVGRQRAAFNQVKAKLRNAGVSYRMLFPAKLAITVDGSKHIFNDPKSAEQFTRSLLPSVEER